MRKRSGSTLQILAVTSGNSRNDMEGIHAILPIFARLLLNGLNPGGRWQVSFCRTRLDTFEITRILQDRAPEECVISYLLVRIAVALVFPAPQNLVVTHQGNWQRVAVHNYRATSTVPFKGLSEKFAPAFRPFARVLFIEDQLSERNAAQFGFHDVAPEDCSDFCSDPACRQRKI